MVRVIFTDDVYRWRLWWTAGDEFNIKVVMYTTFAVTINLKLRTHFV